MRFPAQRLDESSPHVWALLLHSERAEGEIVDLQFSLTTDVLRPQREEREEENWAGQRRQAESFRVDCNLYLTDENGQVLVELADVRVQRVGQSASKERKPEPRDWLYQIQWERQALDRKGQDKSALQQGTWIIFADQRGVGEQLARRIHGEGNRCVLVTPGDEYSAAVKENGDADVFRIINGEITGKATKQVIEAMQATMLAAVMVPILVSTTINT